MHVSRPKSKRNKKEIERKGERGRLRDKERDKERDDQIDGKGPISRNIRRLSSASMELNRNKVKKNT